MSRSATWYIRRLARMHPTEIATRTADRGRQLAWARRKVPLGAEGRPVPGLLPDRKFTSTLPPGTRERIPAAARDSVIASADRLLDGDWTVLGWPRPDIADPDWFLDPVTGRVAPQTQLAFTIDHRDEGVTGNVKAVWELSRHHHLTLLAAAWWLTGDDRYAEVTAAQLRSWWTANPFLSGVHWTSGIELGVRLTSWVWVRRLLDGWPGAAALFEENELALRQIRWHQEYLAAFRSRGSSANNHVVAEACGRLVAACAFPWYAESDRWRTSAAAELETSLAANTYPSGVNRELATDYHRFVTELGMVALVEADRAGHPVGEPTRRLLAGSMDAPAALLDVAGRAPRQGDGDEGRGLVLDSPDADPWMALLATGAAVFAPMGWWPEVDQCVGSRLVGALTATVPVPGRPGVAPRAFPDAGIYLMRTELPGTSQLWCRCDGGPHGFLSIAAHGHADALSLEVRHGRVDVFADPGTYCYHGEPEWRSYFRSTRAHNTVEVDGTNQSVEGGPFLWSTHTDAVVERSDIEPAGRTTGEDGRRIQSWSAHHTGYARLDPALRHTREVTLDTDTGELVVVDTLTGSRPHTACLSWHLGPRVSVALGDDAADLSWPGVDGPPPARLHLPEGLTWTAHRGETDPILGWYSPRFGERVPTTVLVGTGAWAGTLRLRTILRLSGTRTEPATGSRTTPKGTMAELTLGDGNPRPRGKQ
jgi:hypothetical protein